MTPQMYVGISFVTYMFDGGHGGCDNGSSDGCWGNHRPLEVEGISSTKPLRVGLSISSWGGQTGGNQTGDGKYLVIIRS